jgi:O-antigen ligase/Flp pilus assembly protein TadD
MIQVLFNILFIILPLVFFKDTSELFEFNKILVVYIFTILITASWLYKCIKHKKFIFRRTILDIPIITYLGILLISTIFSIDIHTSIFGYYSRFNGGLLSQICYLLLYFAFVSNLTQVEKLGTISYGLIGTLVASILAILERFGIFTTCYLMAFPINSSCWVQDVQTRVFSTLGQPNWLAALVVALIPLTWYAIISNSKFLVFNQFFNSKLPTYKILWLFISLIFFTTLLFTKSRSGLLAFSVESVIFWGFIFYKEKFKYLKEFIMFAIVTTTLYLTFNTQLITHNSQATPATPTGPVLENGGTESGTIRKYVWLGAINIFKNYPLFGTGPETLAYIFPKFKPVEHNLTSEWDFIYNKAHNEYLNFLANTGLFGLLAYLFIVISSILQIINYSNYSNFRNYLDQLGKLGQLEIALLSGYISILVTNFFGFSVVPVSLLFFLLPALTLPDEKKHLDKRKSSPIQYLLYCLVLLSAYYLLHATYNYLLADISYNKAKNLSRERKYLEAKEYINKAIQLNPSEPIYYNESGIVHSEIALLAGNNIEEETKEYINSAIKNGIKAINLAKNNTNSYRLLSSTYYKFAMFNNEYLQIAEEPLEVAKTISVMDPKIYYQLGILNIKNNKVQLGLSNLEKAVELKPNYKEGRFALGLTYIDIYRYQDAISQFQYILNNIDPNDDLTKKYLQEAISKL